MAALGATLVALALGRLAADNTATTSMTTSMTTAMSDAMTGAMRNAGAAGALPGPLMGLLPTTWLTVASGSAGFLLLATALVCRGRRIGTGIAHATLAGCIVIGVADTLAYTQASQRADRTAELLLLSIAAGGLLVGARWFAGVIAAIALAWLTLALTTQTPAGFYVAGLLASLGLARATRTVRLASVSHLVQLRRQAALSTMDSLSGLPDRRGLVLVGGQLLAIARRNSDAVGCTAVQVVGLQAVRERFGEDAAQALFLHVAHVVRGSVRGTDSVGRWDDDALAVVAHGQGAGTDLLTNRVAYAIEKGCPLTEQQWPRRLRIGHQVREPWDETGLLDTLNAAAAIMDRALPFDPAAYRESHEPQQREHAADEEHRGQQQTAGQHHDLHHAADQVAGPAA